MTVPTHFRIVFRGVFEGTPEIWSYSTKWRRDVTTGGDAELGQLIESDITTAATAFHADTMFTQGTRLMEWRAYQIGTDGKMEGDPLITDLSTSTINGTGTARSYPTDVALCVTTEADNRGPAKYGRFYLPGPHAQLGSDRLIATSWLDPVVTRTVTFLKAISDAIDLPGTIDSAEMLNISALGSGAKQPVNNIRIGRVLDRIERRRNKLLEDYHVSGTIDW